MRFSQRKTVSIHKCSARHARNSIGAQLKQFNETPQWRTRLECKSSVRLWFRWENIVFKKMTKKLSQSMVVILAEIQMSTHSKKGRCCRLFSIEINYLLIISPVRVLPWWKCVIFLISSSRFSKVAYIMLELVIGKGERKKKKKIGENASLSLSSCLYRKVSLSQKCHIIHPYLFVPLGLSSEWMILRLLSNCFGVQQIWKRT